MLEFLQEGSKVQIKIDTGVSVDENCIVTEWECGNEMFAKLLLDQLRSRRAGLIEAIRQEEYERGYSDKTKRKPRSTWFSGLFKKIHNQ